MEARARRLKRAIAAIGASACLVVGVVCAGTVPTEGLAFGAIGAVAYVAAWRALRVERRLRPGNVRTRRVPTVALVTIAIAVAGGSFVAANVPLHGEFSGEACGSVLAPRTLDVDLDCADPRGSMADISLTSVQVAGVIALIAIRRTRRATRGRGVLIVVVALTILGTGAIPALATEREMKFENSVHVSPAAKPFARAFCAAQAAWAAANIRSAQDNAPRLGDGPLATRRSVLVGIVSDMTRATAHLRHDRYAAAREFAVPGARTLVDLVDPQMRHVELGLNALLEEARDVPVDTESHFDAAKATIARRIGNVGSVAMPHVPRDHDLATVLATMRAVPDCLGMV